MIRILNIALLAIVLAACSPTAPRQITYSGSENPAVALINGVNVLSIERNAPECPGQQAFLDQDEILMGACGLTDRQVLALLREVAPTGWQLSRLSQEEFEQRRAALDRQVLDQIAATFRAQGFRTYELPSGERFSIAQSEIDRAFATLCEQVETPLRCDDISQYRWEIAVETSLIDITFYHRARPNASSMVGAFSCIRRADQWDCLAGQHGPAFVSPPL